MRVNIRTGTNKVPKERTFWCRGGDYLQRWKAIQKEYGESTDGLIFSLDGEKVNNYALAKHVGIEVEQRNTEEEWDVAYKRRVVSVAVSRKKKVAVDAIKSVGNGVFPI